MASIDLYNLIMGNKRPPDRWASVQVGPFHVTLVPDYDEKVACIGVHGSRTVSQDFVAGERAGDPMIEVRTTTFAEARRGGWEATATATLTQEQAEPSILGLEPIADGGLWDLCTLLTFVTGRRVALATQCDRFDANAYGTNACLSIETLDATALAWQHRQEIVSKELSYALLLHNEALGYPMLQVAAGLNSAALNILVDRHPGKKSVLSEECRKALKTAVSTAVESCEGLPPSERDGFKALLGSRIDQGLGSSLTDKTRALLIDLGVIPNSPNAEADRRVKFMNAVRNAMIHSGKPPVLKGLDREKSMRYVLAIITGVVPQITILQLGRTLGFVPHGLGSLSQNTRDLSRFFLEGIWRDWPLEMTSFEEWFYLDNDAIEDALA